VFDAVPHHCDYRPDETLGFVFRDSVAMEN
jgi:hypothetical protein